MIKNKKREKEKGKMIEFNLKITRRLVPPVALKVHPNIVAVEQGSLNPND